MEKTLGIICGALKRGAGLVFITQGAKGIQAGCSRDNEQVRTIYHHKNRDVEITITRKKGSLIGRSVKTLAGYLSMEAGARLLKDDVSYAAQQAMDKYANSRNRLMEGSRQNEE